MDVVDFFSRQVEQWNNDEKCGFCWEFDAPLTDAGVNESVKKSDDCCIRVFITNLSHRKNRTYQPTTKLLTDYTIDHTFTLHLLKLDRVDTNVYSEQLGHPVSESKWETILKPLEDCVCEAELLKFCDLICKKILIMNWNAVTRINWLDNYTGWSITMTLRDYDCINDNCDVGS